jgi:hypothetical protein
MTVIGEKSRKTAFALLMFVLSSPAWAEVKVHGAMAISIDAAASLGGL